MLLRLLGCKVTEATKVLNPSNDNLSDGVWLQQVQNT